MTLADSPTLSHRTWPLPGTPWRIAMSWCDLAFLHWPVPDSALRPHIPRSLEIDTFDGTAWLGIVPFFMSDVRHRGLPAFPGTTEFPELNVRTYVTADEKPGVWFLSLDAACRAVVWGARLTFALPYYHARMKMSWDNDQVHYTSRRKTGGPAEFIARYVPAGPEAVTQPGELDHWLSARYCLYSATKSGRVRRGEIDHDPWRLAPASVQVDRNTMTAPLGIELPDIPPIAHFARRIDARAWRLE